MSEPVVVDQPTNTPSPFGQQAWTETPPIAVEPPKQDPPPVVVTPPAVEPIIEEEILDPKDWLKREFDVDDPETLKNELKTLRDKAQTPSEIKFANEASEKFFNYLKEGKEDDVYSFLDTKRKLSTAEKLNAADAIKLQIAQINRHYTPEDIQDVYEERYSIPKKPVQAVDEDDDDYNARVNEWQSTVDKVNRKIERDAITAKQELSKLNSELILPDIKKEVAPENSEAKQKELDRINELRAAYLSSLESDYKNFNGYEMKYKDEEVEIPVNFGISDEEKVALKTELATFDVDGFITSRWFDKEGKPNIAQMMDDVTLLRNKEKVLQKMVNEVGSKMKEHYIKLKANISVNGSQQQSFQPKNQNQNGSAPSPFSAGAWSETPPVITQN